MCGIAGVVALGSPGGEEATRPTREAALAMAETLRHRGPDERSAYLAPSGRCALGHSRLEVIDLETGGQPMANEDETVWVVYNGEIYNFRELREELKAAGHTFRTTSDTEVLVHGYEEWGQELAGHLDGMFAFGLWDEGRKRLLLCRDRAGQKPLFLYRDGERLIFASEMKAILAMPGVDDTLDPKAFPLYLTYGYVPTPGTFYRKLEKLPPATCMTVERDGVIRTRGYWAVDFAPVEVGEGRAGQRIRELVEAAVERRLVADVPLGAFLSGGVDSTVVVALMSRFMDEPVRTFSIGFEDDPTYDETHFARMVAHRYDTDHTVFTVGAQSIDLVDELVEAYDEPFGDSSAIPTHIVSGLTRRHVTVALSGDGGDELFAGYPRFLGASLAEAMPDWLASVGDAVGRALPHHPNIRSFPRRFARFFAAASLSEEERWLRWIGYFADRLDEVLHPDLHGLLDRDVLTRSFREPLERYAGHSTLTRVLALNFETYLLDDLLVKSDRCSMAHGLELRAPFLDTELMETAAALPDRFRIRGRQLKYMLRKAFEDLIPDEIAARQKMGFGVPLPTWFRNQWRPVLEERVLAADARLWRWLRREPILAMANEHFAGEADHGHQLWALLTLETWLRKGDYTLP